MDMEYMGAGYPSEDFLVQLKDLKAIKQRPEWTEKIFPFVFADPRRVNITALVKEYLTDSTAPSRELNYILQWVISLFIKN
jgi:hypothetical protein